MNASTRTGVLAAQIRILCNIQLARKLQIPHSRFDSARYWKCKSQAYLIGVQQWQICNWLALVRHPLATVLLDRQRHQGKQVAMQTTGKWDLLDKAGPNFLIFEVSQNSSGRKSRAQNISASGKTCSIASKTFLDAT